MNDNSPETMPPLWKAAAVYRTDGGEVDVEWNFEEIMDLHNLIEQGPDWNTLIRCTVTLNRVLCPGLTVEASERL